MNWPVKKLGNFIEIVMGQAPHSDHCNKEGEGVVFVKAGEFGIESPVIREWTTDPLKMAKADDTLICVVGATAGKINRSRFECAIGRSVAALRTCVNQVEQNYLHAFLSTKVIELRNRSQGAAQAVITREMLQDIEIPLPPLAEQQRIASLLDTADRILKLRESAIAKLDALAQSWFNELISQPNIDHINLKQLCEISSGFAFKSELYSDDGNAHIIRISDIQNNVVTIKESARMALSNVGKGLTCKLNSNDILMAMSGATTGKFGILEDIKTTQVFLNQRVGRFVIKDEKKLSRQFLIALINSDFYKSHVLNTAAGAAQPNISSKQLVDIEIKLPSLIQQSEFSKRIEMINHNKQRSMAFIERESALITSLQHQSFTVN